MAKAKKVTHQSIYPLLNVDICKLEVLPVLSRNADGMAFQRTLPFLTQQFEKMEFLPLIKLM
jgi:hypothetical protein